VEDHKKRFTNHNVFQICRLRGLKREGLQITFDKEQDRLKTLKEGRSFDYFYDGSKTHLDIWRDIRPEIQLSLEEHESCMFMATGLSGSGKTHILLSEDGLVNNTLMLLFDPNLQVWVCEADPETNAIVDLHSKKIINGWSGATPINGKNGLAPMKGQIFDALKSRQTLKTHNNDSSSHTHLAIKIQLSTPQGDPKSPGVHNENTKKQKRKAPTKTFHDKEDKAGAVYFFDLVGLEAGDAAGTSGKINQTSVMVNRSLRDLRTHGTTGIGGGILNLMKPQVNTQETKKVVVYSINTVDSVFDPEDPLKQQRFEHFLENIPS